MDSNFILLINGSTGVGKTTAAQVIAKSFIKGVSIDVDSIKKFIKTGDPGMLGYKKEIEMMKQKDAYYVLIHTIVCDIATRFIQDGYVVVISDMIWEEWIIEMYKKRLKMYHFFHILLQLPFEAQKQRLANRINKLHVSKYNPDFVDRILHFSHAIDNLPKVDYIAVNIERLTSKQVAQMIIERINRTAFSQ